MAAPHDTRSGQRETPGRRLVEGPGVQVEHQTVGAVSNITARHDSTLPTPMIHRALRYLGHRSPVVRDAFLLGTRIGREQAMDALDAYTAHNLRRFLNDTMGAPPWVASPIAGYDYALTPEQRRAMFTTPATGERGAAA